MSKIAFIFPGQGSQAVGMGVSVTERHPEALAIFKQASELLNFDLLDICREGPEERLRQTDIAQPALYVSGYAVAVVLKKQGIEPAAYAGHSIGEYAALAAADVFSFAEGLRLVNERGRLMQKAAQERPGAMVAALGLTRDQAFVLCKDVASDGIAVPVNFNSPEQIVIAGEKKAIDRLTTLGAERGAKRMIPLSVSGAFHSPLMKDAADAMRTILGSVVFKAASVPVAMNVDGQLKQSPIEISEALARQLDSAVEWVKSVETLSASGCDVFVECGSGRVLAGLLKRINKQLQVLTTETAETLAGVSEALGAARRIS